MGLKNFENRLVNTRKEKGYTQEELAIRLGVTPQAISKWERGLGFPDLEMLYYLCEVLNCSADDLLQINRITVKLTESGDEQQKQQLLYDIIAEPFMLEIGTGLIAVLEEENKEKFPSIKTLREKLAIHYGVLLPVLRIRDSIDIGEYDYRIIAYDQILYSETAQRDEIDFKAICRRIEVVTLENYGKILNRQMVQTLVDNLADKYPASLKGVVPEKVSLPLLQYILAELVVRKKSIRNLVKIIEAIEEESEVTRNNAEILNIVIDRLY